MSLLQIMHLTLFFACTEAVVAPTPPPAALPTLQLSHAEPAQGHTLSLFDDARLTDALRTEAWDFGGPPLGAEETPRWKPFVLTPLVPSVLRLLSAEGQVLEEITLERPLARLAPAPLLGFPPTWFLTVDYSIGMGSYNGPITSLVQIHGDRLHWLEGPKGRLELMSSLKFAWKVDTTTTPNDLLYVYCNPDDTGGGFQITYERFHWDGTVFQSTRRDVPGFLEQETEASFPALTEFPQTWHH